MDRRGTWRQYLLIDWAKTEEPLRSWLDVNAQEQVLIEIRDYLARLFNFAEEFVVVAPPVWRLTMDEVPTPPEQPTTIALPLRFQHEAHVEAFLDAFNAYMNTYYQENGHADAVYPGLNTDMAIQLADYSSPTDFSGFMLGRRRDANRLIGLDRLTAAERAGISGQDVNVVLVDQGIDQGCIPAGQRGAGWTPSGPPLPPPFATPPKDARHSTMMVRNILAVAPKARFFDLPLIREPKYGDLLKFIAAAHAALLKAFTDIQNWRTNFPGKYPGPWVIVNPWAPFDLRRESPKGGYSNNPLNDLNILISTIVASGIDVVFCAGNCGEFCPDGRCGPNDIGPARSILGAASHSRVLCVGAVRVDGMWIGYSSQGPGQPSLSSDKPDICAPCGFAEDHDVFAASNGTSAASGIAAGAVAALRTKWPPERVLPDTLRSFLSTTAQRPAATVWNRQYGFGVLDLAAAYKALEAKYP
jgi:subtilisin family serine protease